MKSISKINYVIIPHQGRLVKIAILLLLLTSVILYSCYGENKISKNQPNDSLYRITKIKYSNDWNVIYATKGDSTFKIITKKVIDVDSNCKRIEKGRYYDLILYSRKNNPPEINGVKISPMNYLDIECYSYDERTEICIEPKKGIYDLHHTPDIKGLCYKKSN